MAGGQTRRPRTAGAGAAVRFHPRSGVLPAAVVAVAAIALPVPAAAAESGSWLDQAQDTVTGWWSDWFGDDQPPAAGAEDGTGTGTTPAETIDYTTEIVGGEAEGLTSLLEGSAQLLTLANRPPASLAGLARRIEGDLDRLRTVLRSEGHWAGTVSATVDQAAKPVQVRVTVIPGEPFTFAAYRIHFVGAAPPPVPPPLDSIGIRLGDRARGAVIVAAGRDLLRHLRNNARPLAEQTDRKIVVDHRFHSVEVDIDIDPGPAAAFGAVRIEGLETVNEAYVRQWIGWSEGEPFDERRTEAFRTDLLETGLFTSVAVDLAETVDGNGRLPVTVRLIEGKHRSVGAAVSYASDRGPGVRVFWRHRNLLGNDEDFEIGLRGDLLQQSAEVLFERPNFGERDRRLFSSAQATRNDTDAFEGLEANATAGIAWVIGEHWEASVALSGEYSDLTDAEGEQTSWLAGLPASLRYNGHDDDLNPTEGARFRLAATPYTGNSGSSIDFLVSEFEIAGYYPFDADKKYILAGRTKLGSITGAETLAIPANRRLYAGGGGSIRGYGFQKVGPLASGSNDPVGGRSLIELAVEMRVRVWGDFGAAAFVDAGQVFDSSTPDFSDPLQWAAGIGARYFTPVGPLRLDVGVPINRRSGIDDPFQIYISLGQAF